jgi:hypothetical protein
VDKCRKASLTQDPNCVVLLIYANSVDIRNPQCMFSCLQVRQRMKFGPVSHSKYKKLKLFLVHKTWNKVGKIMIFAKICTHTHTHTHTHTWLHYHRINSSFPAALWPDSRSSPRLTGIHDHTHGHTALCRTPLDEWSTGRKTSTRQRNTLTTDSHPFASAGFEPVNPAIERLQTHALDLAAAGICSVTLEILTISESWTVWTEKCVL